MSACRLFHVSLSRKRSCAKAWTRAWRSCWPPSLSHRRLCLPVVQVAAVRLLRTESTPSLGQLVRWNCTLVRKAVTAALGFLRTVRCCHKLPTCFRTMSRLTHVMFEHSFVIYSSSVFISGLGSRLTRLVRPHVLNCVNSCLWYFPDMSSSQP